MNKKNALNTNINTSKFNEMVDFITPFLETNKIEQKSDTFNINDFLKQGIITGQKK